MTKVRKEARGGAREGAGAPAKDPQHVKVHYSVRLPKWMATQLDAFAQRRGMSRAEVVEGALRAAFQPVLREPK